MAHSFLDNSIGYSINIGALLLKRELILAFKSNGFEITPEQWALLSRLNEADGISQNELAKATFKDNANITRIINKLVSKRMVQKKLDDTDARATKLFITGTGRAMISKLQPLAVAVLNKATRGLSKKEAMRLNMNIQKIIANLQ